MKAAGNVAGSASKASLPRTIASLSNILVAARPNRARNTMRQGSFEVPRGLCDSTSEGCDQAH